MFWIRESAIMHEGKPQNTICPVASRWPTLYQLFISMSAKTLLPSQSMWLDQWKC